MNTANLKTSSSRGPLDHNVRTQIMEAADQHFSHYGYEKTTVSDLAKSIGFSKAYIYKFFDSKQAIGEAICANCLALMITNVTESMSESPTASIKLRLFFRNLVDESTRLLFNERKIYEIATFAASEKWSCTIVYEQQIKKLITDIILEGRKSGEFERKTPIDNTVDSIKLVFSPFINPLLLQYNLDLIKEAPSLLSDLILRSLAP
jgi:AcrR family transcriptional regulator